jgi:Zn-dependent protease
MGSSIKLFTWLGIPVRVHWSFGLILLYAFWIGFQNSLPLLGIAWLIGLFLAMFGCVLLHEYGHSLTARRYGIETQDIILTPIGGIARLEGMPEKPIQEFWVAVAGPAVNVVIAIVLTALAWIFLSADEWDYFSWTLQDHLGTFYTELFGFSEKPVSEVEEEGLSQINEILLYLPALITVNIGLVMFNMIPAFPMDGGRVLRALLAMKMPRVRATQMASWIGQAIAVLFIMSGIWVGPITKVLIGIFVFTTARSENAHVQQEHFMRQYTARDLLRTHFTRMTSTDWIQSAVALRQQGLERHFLVFNLSDQLLGVLEEKSIVEAIKRRDLSAEIAGYTQSVEVIHVDESMQYIHYLITHQKESLIAVADETGIVGVIDAQGLQNFMQLKV